MTRLKYRQYRINEDTQEFELENENKIIFPLFLIRLGLFLIPDFVFNFVQKKLTIILEFEIEGITLKESILILYRIVSEIAKAKSNNQNQITYESRKEKYEFLVE